MTAAPISLDDALTDPHLLGAALGPVAPWSAWRAILKAAFAEPLTPAELKTFKALAGGRKPPKRRVSELWVGAGRRSGKSRAAALVATYLGAILGDHAHRLAPGEQGVVLLVAPTKEQAGLARAYVKAFLSTSAFLSPLVASETADAIELTNGISIVIGAASYRTTRGPPGRGDRRGRIPSG
jgi:anti-sigma factor RsiW